MSCTCIRIECGTGRGKVQGYSVSTLCDECEAQRIIDVLAEVEHKKKEDAIQMIAERSNKIAEDQLIAEGLIELKDGKLNIKEK